MTIFVNGVGGGGGGGFVWFDSLRPSQQFLSHSELKL